MRLHRANAVRLLALLFAVAWTFSPVMAAVHADQHSHHYCEQHQTFEESSAKGGAVTPVASAPVLGVGDELTSPSHEGCAYLAFSVRSALADGGGCSAPADSEQPNAALSECAGHSAVAILAAAPKSSPPAA